MSAGLPAGHTWFPPKIFISVWLSQGFMKEFQFQQNLIKIGRGLTGDAGISLETASRFHACIEIEKESGLPIFIDMGNEGGSLLNGVRVSRIRIHPDDEIVIGKERLIIARIEGGNPDASLRRPQPQAATPDDKKKAELRDMITAAALEAAAQAAARVVDALDVMGEASIKERLRARLRRAGNDQGFMAPVAWLLSSLDAAHTSAAVLYGTKHFGNPHNFGEGSERELTTWTEEIKSIYDAACDDAAGIDAPVVNYVLVLPNHATRCTFFLRPDRVRAEGRYTKS